MIYNMYAAVASSTDSAATIDIREDDTITCVYLNPAGIAISDGSAYVVQLSFASTNQFTSNDAASAIITYRREFELMTSGAAAIDTHVVLPCNIPVQGGERIHLHILVSTMSGCNVRASLHTSKGTRAVTSRRRG